MKIAITGPESSGKTSISKELSDYFNAQWFPEHARAYLLEKNGAYNYDDIEKIAVQQDEVRRKNQGEGLNVYDTENIVLYIWSIFKYKKSAAKVRTLMANQQFDHYFLCSPEGIPWEDDPLRENPNQREELFKIYLRQLQEQNVDFTILEGSPQKRLQDAIKVIKKSTFKL